eukprot:GDKH01024503.1.p2 GENE.GDKH01024503.1~~GDKH01024503.1.p2  ORF type:complete len:60 (-),score=1.35 GDKH01024503.1:11-190(-)
MALVFQLLLLVVPRGVWLDDGGLALLGGGVAVNVGARGTNLEELPKRPVPPNGVLWILL